MLLHLFTDELEIEDWFVEEKRKLDERLYSAAYARKDLKAAKARYDKAFSGLLARYEQEHLSLLRRQARRRRLHRSLERLQSRKELLLGIRKIWEVGAERYKRWRLDRQYRRLMRG